MSERVPSQPLPDSEPLPEQGDAPTFESVSEIATVRMEAPRVVETLNGILAYGTDEGLGHSPNEDRIVVDTKDTKDTKLLSFAVIDGHGSVDEGGVKKRVGGAAADVVANELWEMFDPEAGVLTKEDFVNLHQLSRERMIEAGAEAGGVCYFAAWLHEGKLEGYWAGDVQLAVYGSDGRLKYVSEADRVLRVDSKGRKRMLINNGIFGESSYASPGPQHLKPFEVAVGDRIVIVSDGVSDNYDDFEELGQELSGLSPEAAVKKLANTLPDRMDPYGKPDNRAAVIFDITRLP